MRELDVADPTVFRDGHPFELYDYWRAQEPVHRVAGGQGIPPYWVLTQHADIDRVSRDSASFSSTGGFRMPTYDEVISRDAEVSSALGSMIMTMDPPDHTEMRKQLAPSFSAAGLQELQGHVDVFVRDLIEQNRGRREIEVVRELAAVVPIRTLCVLLGVPQGDEAMVLNLTNRTVGAADPEYAGSPQDAAAAFADMFAYGARLLDQRDPTADDLLSVVAGLTMHDEPIDENTRRGLFTLLIAAGNETTRNSLTGGIIALSNFPDQRELLVERPDLIPHAVLEIIRYVTPVYQMMRVATRDVMINDTLIRAGERVVLLYGAANTDPLVFDDPHRLDITRGNAGRHLAFGVGAHYCIGARVALIQLTALLRELLDAFPQVTAVGTAQYLTSNFVCSIKRLQVQLEPTGAAGGVQS